VKKQKVITLEDERINKLDLDAIHELQEGLNKVNQFPVYTPDLQWFEQMVLTEQKKTRKNLIKELFIFIMIALFILSGIIVSLFQLPIVFIILQIMTTAFIVVYTFVGLIKKVHIG
jgi:hypothetical protein